VIERVLSGSAAPAVSVIDTSNNYAGGLSETLIGRHLGGRLPERVVIASKLDRDPLTRDFSADRMRRSLDETLTRLGVDRLPLLHLHDPDDLSYSEAFAPGGPVDALVRIQREGLVDRIGISGAWAPMLVRYVETGLFQAVVTHNRYTLVDRSADHLLSTCRTLGVDVFNAAPYGSAPLAKWPAPATRYAYRPIAPAMAEAIDSMGRAAADFGIPLGAAALQFSLRDDRVSSTIVGINTGSQLDRTLEWAALGIPDELWGRLEELAPPASTWQEPPGPSPWDSFPDDLLEYFTS
jgi:D-threo-aldose 1-dehydrogenase